jgi:hypothetical protein
MVIKIDKEKMLYNKGGFCYLIVNDVDEELTSRGRTLGFQIPERAAK